MRLLFSILLASTSSAHENDGLDIGPGSPVGPVGPGGPGNGENSKEMIVCDDANEYLDTCPLCTDSMCDGTPQICRTCSNASFENCCPNQPACKCKPGFVRLKNEIHGDLGRCVPKTFCDAEVVTLLPPSECDINEHWDECGNTCLENFCCPINQKCSLFCPSICEQKCQCDDGFYRNKDGKCISRDFCGSNVFPDLVGIDDGIIAPPEPSPTEPGCIWPANKLTNQDYALFNGTIGERYTVGQLITRSCPSHCGTPSESRNGCFNYIEDKNFICTLSEKRGETFYFWNRIKDTGAVKDAFFAAFHSVPRKISRRHLCKPERIVTNPAIECGPLPAFMPEFSATTFYDSNKSGIVCASGTKVIGEKSKTGKFTPNIKCKTKKHWDGVYRWVHVGPTGKYSALKLNSMGFLDKKYHCS